MPELLSYPPVVEKISLEPPAPKSPDMTPYFTEALNDKSLHRLQRAVEDELGPGVGCGFVAVLLSEELRHAVDTEVAEPHLHNCACCQQRAIGQQRWN